MGFVSEPPPELFSGLDYHAHVSPSPPLARLVYEAQALAVGWVVDTHVALPPEVVVAVGEAEVAHGSPFP